MSTSASRRLHPPPPPPGWSPPPPPPPDGTPWYRRKSAIVYLSFLFPPLGLWWLWKRPLAGNGLRWTVTGGAAFLWFIVIGVATTPAPNNVPRNSASAATPRPSAAPTAAPTAAPAIATLAPAPVPTLAPTPVPTESPAPPAHVLTASNVTQSLYDNQRWGQAPWTELDGLTVEVVDNVVSVDVNAQAVFKVADLLSFDVHTALLGVHALHGWYPAMTSLRVVVHSPVTDGYGQTSVIEAAEIQFSMATMARMSPEGLKTAATLTPSSLYCIADKYDVTPSIWNELSAADRGCMGEANSRGQFGG
jgi:hypothetical protein